MLFLRVLDTYGNKVVRGAGQQAGQLAVQVTIGLQEAGGRASAALADLMGKDARLRWAELREEPAPDRRPGAGGAKNARAGNGRVDGAKLKDIARR